MTILAPRSANKLRRMGRSGLMKRDTGSSLCCSLQSVLPFRTVYGARIHAITQAQCVRLVVERLRAGCGGWIVTVNLNHLRFFARQPQYAAVIQGANMVVADGMPLLWASRLAGTPLPERVPGCELIWSLSQGIASLGGSVFLLGGNPGTAERTAAVLEETYPGLHVAGTLCPRRGFDRDDADTLRVRRALENSQPDVVFVALGTPKEDYWISTTRGLLPRAWWIGVGGGFEFASGAVPRAPSWMRRVGLEWLHRLVLEPRRLGRRYLIEGIPFAFLLFVDSLKRRRMGRSPAARISTEHGRSE